VQAHSFATDKNPPDRKTQRAAFDEIFLFSGVDPPTASSDELLVVVVNAACIGLRFDRWTQPGQYRTPGTINSLATNSLRLDRIWSIAEDIDGLAHDIRGMLRLLGWQEPTVTQPS
jgi:hypothetical protein